MRLTPKRKMNVTKEHFTVEIYATNGFGGTEKFWGQSGTDCKTKPEADTKLRECKAAWPNVPVRIVHHKITHQTTVCA